MALVDEGTDYIYANCLGDAIRLREMVARRSGKWPQVKHLGPWEGRWQIETNGEEATSLRQELESVSSWDA